MNTRENRVLAKMPKKLVDQLKKAGMTQVVERKVLIRKIARNIVRNRVKKNKAMKREWANVQFDRVNQGIADLSRKLKEFPSKAISHAIHGAKRYLSYRHAITK